MSIPFSRLERWSHQGATATPKQLRERIERQVKSAESTVQRKPQLEIYLQGSYRNSTNIYGNSDVDIVVQHDATFFRDISNLDTYETRIYKSVMSEATYTWDTFKNDIIETLRNSFGTSNVEIGNKSIKINDGSYEADVVPCFEYRKYTSFGENLTEQKYIKGIKFFTKNESRSVVNYPKEHFANGAAKNQRVSNQFKPTIRVFKNIKRKLVEKDMITKEQVPSYFIENLLYNVPDQYYEDLLFTRTLNILNWLDEIKSNTPLLSQFICQNEQQKLFGYEEEQWDIDKAQTFIVQANKLWNEW